MIGTGSARHGLEGRIVYAMRVTETMTFNEYWADQRFLLKRPDMRSSLKRAFGDNIYRRAEDGVGWNQIDSHHSKSSGEPNVENMADDTKANRVLISNDFVYWGGNGPKIPTLQGVDICHKLQGYSCNFSSEVVGSAVQWIRGFEERGYCGSSRDWD